MKEAIEQKVSSLNEDIKKSRLSITQTLEAIRQLKEQKKTLEAHINKLSGAIEAFNATVGILNATEKDATVDGKSQGI